MDADAKSAQDDLAFLRSLIQPKDEGQAPFGESYLAGGLAYGLQLIGHWANATGRLPLSGPGQLLLGLGPTVVFLALLTWIIWRHRRPAAGGVTQRTVGVMFAVAGLSNLVLVAMLGTLAAREKSFTIWLIYPCVVFVLQGAAWLVMCSLRRRPWMAVVGIGWFVCALAMSTQIGSANYMLVAAAGMLGLMVVPGLVMLRLARRTRAG